MVLVVFLSSAFLLSYLTFPVSRGSVFSPIRVACVGDSITEGSYYPSDLQGLLGKNYTVGNFGAGGSTVLFSSDKPYIYRIAFQKAMAFHADIVVIMLGTNDATPKYYGKIDNFDRDYKMLIGQFKAENPQIWLVKPPPIFYDGLGPNSANLVNGVIPRIEQVATELGLPIIDVYTLLLNHPEFFTDGVHPGSEGAETVAAAVYQAILNQAS
jgi:lysophospholipase L1-like esterase